MSDARTAVCFTVRNALHETSALLDDLRGQDWQDFLISAVDAHSTDGTYELLRDRAHEFDGRMTVNQVAGNISVGRNAAIELSNAELIVTTDAGVRLPPNWVHAMAAPLLEGEARSCRARYRPQLHADGWHAAISSVITPSAGEFAADKVLPSARGSAFRRDDFLSVGKFPTDLDHTEDVVFFKRLRDLNGPPHRVDDPAITWDARPSLRHYSKQYQNYARGDAMAGLYAVRNLGRPTFYLATAAVCTHGGLGRCLSIMAWGALLRRPLRRLAEHPSTASWSFARKLGSAIVVQVVGDYSKMVGYAKGQAHNVRRTPQR
ncbi:glycosyltransferase [Blastococcus haudaquaticus]|uniref:Glycosyl transferase family 2 n=1 Tax=Blastococcus haudaquaticus TaxID=1938745 RepID=A0A286GY06_9ACTN|nr:Glycosyl transferase family 2 [Blastococcus haudaquaticus]